jgi:hypothetical protein
MTKTKKLLITFLLLTFLNMAFAPRAQAMVGWGEAMGAAFWKQATEEMVKSIYDTTVANLKIAAIRIIQAKLTALMGSSGSSMDGVAGMVISDWKMFIFNSASKYSTQMTDDFFRGLSSGAATGVQQRVRNPAMMAVQAELEVRRPNLQSYVQNGDASLIFQAGKAVNPWVAWNAAAQPQNDVAFTYLQILSVKRAAYEQEVAAKQSEGVAGQGMKSKEITASNGNKLTAPGAKDTQATTSSGAKVSVPAGSSYKGQSISTPGSMIANLKSEVDMIPLRMLSMAQTIPQVVTGMVNQMISQVIQQGASQITNPGSGGSNMSQQFQDQAQTMIQNGIRQAASPNTFFGN